jgi:uncharacterized MAPEG superfamily protein
MAALSHSSVVSTTPYVWSLVLSLGTLLISIILIYIARFQAKLEIKDLAALRTMFDRYPAWGKRASWAQQNSFESFTIHAPAALLAVIASFNGQTLPVITLYAAFGTPIVSSGLYQRLCVQRATRQISVLDAWPGLQWNSVLHRIQCADVMGPGNPA